MNALFNWLADVDTLLSIGKAFLAFMLFWILIRIGLEVIHILLSKTIRLVHRLGTWKTGQNQED